ncbi:MAG: helix-turn-helix transcriptional regulator [Clostridiales bacterium]|nr:helix-turn-helix transcriptional regulator [Clostridiales bacterium]
MIGERIKKYLTSKGITIAWLSRETGIDQSRLYMMLGRVQTIDCRDYYKICQKLELPYGYFIDGDGAVEVEEDA